MLQTSNTASHGDGGAVSESLEALRQLTPIPADSLPEPREIERLLERVRARVALIMSRCNSVDVFVAAQLDFSSTTDDVEAVYADLQLFCRWFSRLGDPEIRSGAPQGYFERARFAAGRLVDAEHLLSQQVQQWLGTLRSRKGADSALRLFLTQVTAWHAYVERWLADREAELSRLLEGLPSSGSSALGAEIENRGSDPETRAADLLRAGELEVLPALTHLVRCDPATLGVLLEPGSTFDRRAGLVERLWSLADLLLAEEGDGKPQTPGQGTSPLIELLCRDSQLGRRFGALRTLLQDAEPGVDDAGLDRRFTAAGRSLDGRERAMLRRAVIVGHSNPEARRAAAAEAQIDTLWQLLAYPGSPLPALHAVAEQVAKHGDDDLRKVFYDCVKSRLFAAISEAEQALHVERVAPFIELFFRFSFFIQTRYFEQLQSLLHLFRSQARRFEQDVGAYDRLFRQLEVARHKAGNPPASTPKSIDRLPLPVQRHLAREGTYLPYFACHANNLIAREVVPYLSAENLGSYLELIELNRQMLEEALRRLDLRGRRKLIQRVLTHPKCPMIFASRHLPLLNHAELHRVVQSRSTHSEVKRKAVLMMIKKKGGTQPGIRPGGSSP
ncbi:MAG: hypothetical protein MI919_42110 [Holophagales bacterium]|nr:hypothetical protein [Holophagales bacterium]